MRAGWMSTVRVDPVELSRLTREAIARAEHERAEQFHAGYEAKERKRREDTMIALHIIGQIPTRARVEALAGKNYAIVMALKAGEDFERPEVTESSVRVCESKWLKGAAKLVYSFCKDADLCPSIQFWYDAVGGACSGFNIVIHWPK